MCLTDERFNRPCLTPLSFDWQIFQATKMWNIWSGYSARDLVGSVQLLASTLMYPWRHFCVWVPIPTKCFTFLWPETIVNQSLRESNNVDQSFRESNTTQKQAWLKPNLNCFSVKQACPRMWNIWSGYYFFKVRLQTLIAEGWSVVSLVLPIEFDAIFELVSLMEPEMLTSVMYSIKLPSWAWWRVRSQYILSEKNPLNSAFRLEFEAIFLHYKTVPISPRQCTIV